MKDLITGLCLLFVVPSTFYFWERFIDIDVKNQKKLKGVKKCSK